MQISNATNESVYTFTYSTGNRAIHDGQTCK